MITNQTKIQIPFSTLFPELSMFCIEPQQKGKNQNCISFHDTKFVCVFFCYLNWRQKIQLWPPAAPSQTQFHMFNSWGGCWSCTPRLSIPCRPLPHMSALLPSFLPACLPSFLVEVSRSAMCWSVGVTFIINPIHASTSKFLAWLLGVTIKRQGWVCPGASRQ